jgi:hypothetical protein
MGCMLVGRIVAGVAIGSVLPVTENIITKRIVYQNSVHDSTALQCRCLASVLNDE